MTDIFEQWTSMQKMFLPKTFTPLDSFRENASRFWENQETILNNMQAFTNSWFEHRHQGTRLAQEAAQRMCGTESLPEMVQAYQDWAKGAFERIMQDGLAYQQQIIAATGALTSPPLAPSPSEKGTEPNRIETKARARKIAEAEVRESY